MACFIQPRASQATFPNFPAGNFADLIRHLESDFSAPAPRPRSFQPKFDVREEKDAYKLNGELPGVEQKDITIEFIDQDTLVVRGRSVRREAKIASPAQAQPAQEKVEAAPTSDTASETGSTYHKPTVEEDSDFVDVPSETSSAAPAAPTGTDTTATEVAKPASQAEKKSEPIKYLLQERATGEFNRSFTFPGHVDQEGVTASLKKGILSVVVPKVVQKEPRKIVIQ